MTVAELIGTLESGKGVKFVSFTYRSKGTNELAKVIVALGHSTEELYRMDLSLLDIIKAGIDKDAEPLKFEAVCRVIASRNESLEVGIGNNSAYTHQDTYVYPKGLRGIRIHKETGECYVSGLLHSKVTLEEGVYKEVKSHARTLAKKEIEKQLPSSKFRMYTLTNILSVTINGETVEVVTG